MAKARYWHQASVMMRSLYSSYSSVLESEQSVECNHDSAIRGAKYQKNTFLFRQIKAS